MGKRVKVLTLSEAVSLVFAQGNSVVAEVTGLPYNTVTSWKWRWNKNLLSAEKSEQIVLAFGLTKVEEFRYKLPTN